MKFLLRIEHQRAQIVAEIIRRLWTRKSTMLQQQLGHLTIIHQHSDIQSGKTVAVQTVHVDVRVLDYRSNFIQQVVLYIREQGWNVSVEKK